MAFCAIILHVHIALTCAKKYSATKRQKSSFSLLKPKSNQGDVNFVGHPTTRLYGT